MSIATIRKLLADDAQQFKTPCYLYSPEKAMANFSRLRDQLGTGLIVSVKANSTPDILLRCAHVMKDGNEVASAQELNKVAGAPGVEKFLNNPSANGELLRYAIAAKATLIIDHPSQLERAITAAQGRSIKPVMLRVNGAVLTAFNPEHPKVRDDHFGMDLDGLFETISIAKNNDIEVRGIQCFKGSYTFSKTALQSIDAVVPLVKELEQRLGYQLTTINLGGGFSEDLCEDFDFEQYRSRLADLQQDYEVLHESGRAIYASAGFFLTRVVSTKQLNDRLIVVCDGGIGQNFLLAQTENVFRKHAKPELCHVNETSRTTFNGPMLFVGSSCSKDDVIGQWPEGGAVPAIGDVCIFSHCGAYNRSYSPVNFLDLPPAREYLFHESR
ncbi:PLP-dependent decarboxylase [Marinobacteraceae bacterium S3BR75-40.1]